MQAKTKGREELHLGGGSRETKGHHAQEQDLSTSQASRTRVLAKSRIPGTRVRGYNVLSVK